MKKFFSHCLCAAIIALSVSTFIKGDATQKMSAHAMTSVMGAAIVRPTGGKRSALLAKLRKAYPGNPVIEEGELRMEALLVNGQGEYIFKHKSNDSESATELRLAEQDLFATYDIGIFLMAEDQSIRGTGVLSTFPNPTEFPDEVNFVVNKHLEHIYNGKLKIKVGDTTYNNGMAVRDARVVNTSQQTGATNRNETRAGDGFLGTTQTYKIKGMEKVDLILKVPSDSQHKIQSGTTTKLKVVLVLKGFTVTGAGSRV